MARRVIVDQIEVTRKGHIQIRLRKQLVDEGEVFDLGFHRTIIEVGGDVAAQIALVNTHLGEMGFPPIDPKELGEIQEIAEVVFKPEKVAAHADRAAKAVLSLPKEGLTNDSDTLETKKNG